MVRVPTSYYISLSRVCPSQYWMVQYLPASRQNKGGGYLAFFQKKKKEKEKVNTYHSSHNPALPPFLSAKFWLSGKLFPLHFSPIGYPANQTLLIVSEKCSFFPLSLGSTTKNRFLSQPYSITILACPDWLQNASWWLKVIDHYCARPKY